MTNDFKTTSDYDAAVKYVDQICPTYYSFNIGKIHYVVMDDIDCSGYDGTDSRNYVKSLSGEQLDWLAKDLSYVAKTTPVVVAMHAQVFYPTTTGFKIDHDSANTQRLFDILDGYTVHFVTGHTHMTFNVTPDASIVGGRNFPGAQLRFGMRFVVVVRQPHVRSSCRDRRNPRAATASGTFPGPI